MSPILALALRVIPADLREKYSEIWRADNYASDGYENGADFKQFQFLSLGLQLRWQSDSFRLGRLAIRALIVIALVAVYAEFGLVRDMLVLLIVWWLIKRSDFRAIHSKRALEATGVHLVVSLCSFVLGLLVFITGGRIEEHEAHSFQTLAVLGNLVVALSFLTAACASFFWIADFVTTKNVFVTGKLFLVVAIGFLGIQWLQQARNVSELIDSASWVSSALAPLSRVQQVTSNLVLPLLLILSGLHALTRLRGKRRNQASIT